LINNYICDTCDKQAVCKSHDVLHKFHEDNKKPLGVEITIDKCFHYSEDGQGGE